MTPDERDRRRRARPSPWSLRGASYPQEMWVSGVPRRCGGHHPVGDAECGPIRLSFDPQLRVEFRGATVTSDAGLLLPRELDKRRGLDALIARHLTDPRIGHNRQFRCRTFSVSRSTAGWPATRIPTTPSDWPRTRRFGCWPHASGGRRASRSLRRSTGSRRGSSRRSGTTKDWLASTRH